MNLCEVPFASLSERQGKRPIMEFAFEDFDQSSRRRIERRVTVKGDPEFGLPLVKDEEIYLGLMKLTFDRNGFSDPRVTFKRGELFELMDWPRNNWAYKRLAVGMQRLVGVRLTYHNFWRDNRNREWRNQGAFSILDSFEFRDSRIGKGASFSEAHSEFRWSGVLFESFDSGYLKRIDYDLARSLTPTARRLYRYLDKHFYPPKRTTLTLDVARVAYEHVGVSRNVELDKVRKRHLGPAVEELQEAGFLKSKAVDACFERVRRGEWTVTVSMQLEDKRYREPKSSPSSSEPVIGPLVERGMTITKATLLAREHKAEKISAAIRCFDEQRARGVAIRSPDGWFAKVAENGLAGASEPAGGAKRPERQLFRAPRRG